jgi:hypothetical protein
MARKRQLGTTTTTMAKKKQPGTMAMIMATRNATKNKRG